MSDIKQLGRYQIEARLGEGAFADVYRARDILLERVVALKILKPRLLADEEAYNRFLKEAKAAANLMHPHIAWVWDLGETDGRCFIAMRYVDGPSLDHLLQTRGPLPWEDALRIAKDIADALDFAHRKGLVHRDVKPQNIIVSSAEGAVLTDFGLVKAIQASGMSTRSGAIIGTPQYIPPEVWKGQEATPESDQYALACVLVEMLTGKSPFDAPTPPAVMLKHFEPLALPEAWPAGTPECLGEVLRRALAKESAERYTSVGVFVAEPDRLADIQRKAAEAARSEARTQNHQLSIINQQSEIINQQSIILTLAPGVTMEFVRVPAGRFLMGSNKQKDKDASDDELPQHEVSLEEYCIGRYPVTNLQYRVFTEAAKYKLPDHWEKGTIPISKENHPVVQVNWDDAVAFCKWASQATGELIRLPTEAEWEKAARGIDGRIYPWGNESPHSDRCNFNGKVNDTTPVGQYSPQGDSPYGCADMAGNVWEWVADWYGAGYYTSSPASNPAGPSSGKFRVLRGGSWGIGAWYIRAADRYWCNPDDRSNYDGFRCSCKWRSKESCV